MFDLILFIGLISCILILVSFKLYSSIMKFKNRSKLSSLQKEIANAPLPINIDLPYCTKLQKEINSKWLDGNGIYMLESLNDYLEEARLWHTNDKTELKRLKIKYAVQLIANLYINLEGELRKWNDLKFRNQVDPDLQLREKSIEKELLRVKDLLDIVSPSMVAIKNDSLINDTDKLKELLKGLYSVFPNKEYKRWHIQVKAILETL